MSKQTPMMQLIEDLRESGNHMAANKAEHYLPIEQQAFEDAFDVGIKEEYEHNAYGAAYTYEDGRDYYNQTFKS